MRTADGAQPCRPAEDQRPTDERRLLRLCRPAVLLTAYADTSAAIDAINPVDLDHCLLKPWDPPEEKPYPVLDDLLAAWRASEHRPAPSVQVVGHRWSARSSEVREFLARNHVPYRWYSADDPEGRRLLAAAGHAAERLPLVVTPDGIPLVEPDDRELAARVGLATTPAEDFHDLVVIGGGPAGLAQLDAPGLTELTGRGVFYGSALTETSASSGHDVYIVGGANSAGQAAMHLSNTAKSVTLLVRGRSLAASM